MSRATRTNGCSRLPHALCEQAECTVVRARRDHPDWRIDDRKRPFGPMRLRCPAVTLYRAVRPAHRARVGSPHARVGVRDAIIIAVVNRTVTRRSRCWERDAGASSEEKGLEFNPFTSILDKYIICIDYLHIIITIVFSKFRGFFFYFNVDNVNQSIYWSGIIFAFISLYYLMLVIIIVLRPWSLPVNHEIAKNPRKPDLWF